MSARVPTGRGTPEGLAEETLRKGLFVEVGRVKRTIKDGEGPRN